MTPQATATAKSTPTRHVIPYPWESGATWPATSRAES